MNHSMTHRNNALGNHPTRTFIFNFALAVFVAFATTTAAGQNPLSVSKPEQDNSVAAEMKSFTLADGYEVSLFADETDGVANPVCMSWDPAGRLWVLVTWAYPQLKPVDKPDDKLLILADTNGLHHRHHRPRPHGHPLLFGGGGIRSRG